MLETIRNLITYMLQYLSTHPLGRLKLGKEETEHGRHSGVVICIRVTGILYSVVHQRQEAESHKAQHAFADEGELLERDCD